MKKYFALVLIIAASFLLFGCSNTSNMPNDVELAISLYKIADNNYTVGIKDAGFHPEFPLWMDIDFMTDEDNMIQYDSVSKRYGDAAENTKYDSVTVYLNDESDTVKFVWITIHSAILYSDTGEFVKREPFEYELTFRVDTDSLEVFDIVKEISAE